MKKPLALLMAAVALTAMALRVHGIQNHFWMLEDQIRDWGIAAGPFWRLPLVGPPTHVHGYTIGPAFYWILWAIRVVVGPFFENLPHAGGIGQAALQTAADTMLLVAIWRRTGSASIALASFIVVVSSGFDLALSGLVWNPTMGSTLSKVATALVLLDWHRRSSLRLATVAAIAWASIHAYTGAVFVALPALLAIVLDMWRHAGRRAAIRALAIVAVVVAALQVPYLAYQITQHFAAPAMGAVTGSVAEILSGHAAPTFTRSLGGYRDAVRDIQVMPFAFPGIGWLLTVAGLLTAWLWRRDPTLLLMILAPQAAAIAGFAFFLGSLDSYYYLSMMPAAVLTVLLPLTRITWPVARRVTCVAVLLAACTAVPARWTYSQTQFKLPEYKVLVAASRTVRNAHRPFRAIVADFPLPPTCDPDFLYRLLGGQMDRRSPWVAVISLDGRITYINNDLNRARAGNQ